MDPFSFLAVDDRPLEQRGAGDDGAQRVSQVVRNDGQKFVPGGDRGLGVGAGGSLRNGGALEGHGLVLELDIHPVQFELARPELIERTEQIDVLLAYLLHRARRSQPGKLVADTGHEVQE